MSKENKKAGSGEKKGTLGRWFSRLFFPNKEMDIYAEEALQSPARMVAKSFFSKPLAVISLVLLILIMLFVFIAPSFVVLDFGRAGQHPGQCIPRIFHDELSRRAGE